MGYGGCFSKISGEFAINRKYYEALDNRIAAFAQAMPRRVSRLRREDGFSRQAGDEKRGWLSGGRG